MTSMFLRLQVFMAGMHMVVTVPQPLSADSAICQQSALFNQSTGHKDAVCSQSNCEAMNACTVEELRAWTAWMLRIEL